MSIDEECRGCKYGGFANEFCNNCEDYDSYVSDGRAELAALRAKFDEAKGVFALTATALNEEISYRKGLEAEVARLKGEVERKDGALRTIEHCSPEFVVQAEARQALAPAPPAQAAAPAAPACASCGKPKSDSKHICYGNDIDNPVKHEFVPAPPAAPVE